MTSPPPPRAPTKPDDEITKRRRYKLLPRIGLPERTLRRLSAALNESPETATAREIDAA
jgi:hypothetical protein